MVVNLVHKFPMHRCSCSTTQTFNVFETFIKGKKIKKVLQT